MVLEHAYCTYSLERNRESARQSRRRKKQQLEQTEARVAALHEDIASLRLQRGHAVSKSLSAERQLLLSAVQPLAECGCEDETGECVAPFAASHPRHLTPEEKAQLQGAASNCARAG